MNKTLKALSIVSRQVIKILLLMIGTYVILAVLAHIIGAVMAVAVVLFITTVWFLRSLL